MLQLLQLSAFGLAVLFAVLATITYDKRFEPHKTHLNGTVQAGLLGIWSVLCIASIVVVLMADRLV